MFPPTLGLVLLGAHTGTRVEATEVTANPGKNVTTNPGMDLNGVNPVEQNVSVSTEACDCVQNVTDHFLEHANIMKDEMQNKTSLLSKIRHRTTRSHEAVWASFSLSFVVVLLVVGVLQSRMWQHRPHVSSMQSQTVKYIQYNSMAEIKVKDMVRARGRSLLSLFSRRPPSSLPGTLRMEVFLQGASDQVDGGHRALLDSSSSEGEDSEEEVFSVNRRTGEWQGEGARSNRRAGDWEREEARGLLGNRRTGDWEGEEARGLLGRRRRRRSSSGSSSLGLHSDLSRDLIRLSTDEEEEEEIMVKVG